MTHAKPDKNNGKTAVKKYTKTNDLPCTGLELEHIL